MSELLILTINLNAYIHICVGGGRAGRAVGHYVLDFPSTNYNKKWSWFAKIHDIGSWEKVAANVMDNILLNLLIDFFLK